MFKIAAIILAAGASTRMKGRIKQVLPWGNSTLLAHSITELQQAKVAKIYVVLGANYDLIAPKLPKGNQLVIYNENWSLGLGSTISKGVETLMKSDENFDAVLIALADQPLFDTEFYHELIQKFNSTKATVVSTNYGSKKGVPAIFGKYHFNSLVKLDSDFGAAEIIKTSEHTSIDGFHKTTDIDTWEEYQILFNSKN